MNWRGVFTNWRVVLLLIFLVFAVTAIHPRFEQSGVVIRAVLPNSSAADAGMRSPPIQASPLAKERILSFNNEPVPSEQEYYRLLGTLDSNRTVMIETSKQWYTLHTRETPELGLRVQEAPRSNLRKGLDLAGGTRVVLQPTHSISKDEMELTIASLSERLNVFGLSDVVIRSSRDFSGNEFIVVEIAGLTEEEVKDLLARQGKFEAKIGNATVFLGGKQDITYVCRSAECSGIDPNRRCSPAEGGYFCSFFFSISLSPEAAARQGELTGQLELQRDASTCYLNKDIVLFLDDKEVDSLKIGCELKGRAVTDIQISGSGNGRTEQEAVAATLQNMKRLQTIIITGSLPVTLDVVKMDTISPSLGKEFLSNILLVGMLAVIAVVMVILIRYRRTKIVAPLVFVLLSEMVLILGFAALVGWNLDLAAIAGIIITAGTAVDHLIIITDEALRGEHQGLDWKRRIKNALVIIVGAYLTTVSGMIPLWFAGAGMLKGFAFTTIAGLSFGVLIARPAYAAMVEKFLS